ncbi:MAG: hypothetical protein QXP59_07525 [Saccharolobus sp.]
MYAKKRGESGGEDSALWYEIYVHALEELDRVEGRDTHSEGDDVENMFNNMGDMLEDMA